MIGRGRTWPIAIILATLAAVGEACPFCDVVGRPLAARRDASIVVAIGEADGEATESDGVIHQPVVVRSVVRGDGVGVGDVVRARVPARISGTACVFGSQGDEASRYEAIAASEILLSYVVAAPSTEAPVAERLRWFARWLEHPDRAIAEDSFVEFGLAPYGDVVAAADALDATKLRQWLDEPAIDERRRGFYGLALGIVAARARATGNAAEADASLAFLDREIRAPAHDFRAGYDGLLGGLLVARGEAAIDTMAELGLLSDSTRAGDARHALAALRFAWESLERRVPRKRVSEAAARLVTNSAVAAEVVVDLARYEHWASIDVVAGLWSTLGREDPLVRRAVAGYLKACPIPAAHDHAARIAAMAPVVWDAAEKAASLPARTGD